MKKRFTLILIIFLSQLQLVYGQDVLSIKGRRAIVSYDPAFHVVQIGQEYSTQRTPGATLQVQEIGERFLLTILVEGRLREDDLIDFSLASKLKEENQAPHRAHHLSVGLGVTNLAAMVVNDEQMFEASSASGLILSYHYGRNQKWDFGFKFVRQSASVPIGEDLLFYYRQDNQILFVSDEFEAQLQKILVTARRGLWSSIYLELGLGIVTYTLEGEYRDTSNFSNVMESSFSGIDMQADLGYQLKIKERYFLEAQVGASLMYLNSIKIDNPNNLASLDFEGSTSDLNTGFQLRAGFSF